ncbi:hypothetical protein WR25_16394 [Diploscapter pachys]|jgi:hypothetical protein|uniref:Uncharacterized protein n=1 Tax=Diploscapter pachys TaxID=2018661 RepID=A0A2A2K9I5_9BILA|nr:hypothetical protein WR25_16394 [Diploscapter pachys]
MADIAKRIADPARDDGGCHRCRRFCHKDHPETDAAQWRADQDQPYEARRSPMCVGPARDRQVECRIPEQCDRQHHSRRKGGEAGDRDQVEQHDAFETGPDHALAEIAGAIPQLHRQRM